MMVSIAVEDMKEKVYGGQEKERGRKILALAGEDMRQEKAAGVALA